MTFSERLRTYTPPAAGRRRAAPKGSLKILHLLSQQPAKTGSGVCLLAMAAHGAEAGYRQRAVIGLPAAEPVPAIPPLSPDGVFAVRFESPPVPFRIPGMSDVMPYPSTRFSDFTIEMLEGYLNAFAAAFSKATDGFVPDIIHANHHWLMTALARVLFPETPICAQSHGTELRQLVNAAHLAPYVVPACADVDTAFALHPENARGLKEAFGFSDEKVQVVGAGFRDDLFCAEGECRLPRKDGELRVVYAGKLAVAKGVLWLIEAVEKIRPPEKTTVTLMVAGTGGDEEAEQIRAAAAGSDRVHFLGALPQNELAKVFRSADVFVLPSMFEGLPLVVIEALACGCLAVVSDLPGIDDWMPHRLCEQGLVERVAMPRLVSLDTPDPDAVPAFIEDLAAALTTQLQRAAAKPDRADTACHLVPLTWRGVFEKVKAVYEGFCEGS
ncbi:MAG: glycosyltransferase family 4 protein [Desulfobacterales bacterium]|nr:glycosyltransferase family 4 protein [Desulfobacterales bacterium]